MYATGPPRRGAAAGGDRRRTAAVRLRGQRVETHFTNGYDPTRGPAASSTSPSRPLSPRSSATPSRPDHPTWRAKVRHLPPLDELPAPGPDHRDPRHREEPRRPALRPFPGPDGHRCGQDFTAVTRLPAAEVRRLPAHPVPRRPQQPRRADHRRVPELPHPRRRAPLHRDLQRRQAHQRRDARLLRRRRLHDPAVLLGPARPGGHRPATTRTSTTTSPTPRSPSPTPDLPAGGVRPRHRRRGAPLHLRACGAGCSSTSTPTSSA
jgi:hypothetical protein